MAYYTSHDSFISGAGKEAGGYKKQNGKRRKCDFSDNKEPEMEKTDDINAIKQSFEHRDSKKIPTKAVSCGENRKQELISVEGAPSESLTFCKVNKSLKQTEPVITVECTERQSEENTNAEEMKTEIYVKIETVENVTLTLRESDRKLAPPMCVGEENNDKECIADYNNGVVRQKGDLFPEIIDVNIKKKEAFPEESEMKNVIAENTFENIIEKSHGASMKHEMTHLDPKVFDEESCDETKQESTNNEKINLDNVKDNKVENVGDEYEDFSDIESSNSSQTSSIHNHKEKESESIIHSQEIELIADTLCFGEENNGKECKADYDDSNVRQNCDPFSDIIDVKQKKKEASSKANEIKNDNDENTFENLIEKNHEVSEQNKITHSDSKVFNDQSCNETNENSVNNEKIKVSEKENKEGNVGDEYEDWSDIESSNSIYNHQEKEYEAIILSQERELLADTNENKKIPHNIEYGDLKSETGENNETEDIEERKEENGIGETEEPAENSDFQIESVYEEKATKLVGANESGIIADETEDCEIIANETKNKIVNKNSEDERKEQKEESNNDFEIIMNTTNEEIKLHTEEQKNITDVTCNMELSEENDGVTFENCLLDSKTETGKMNETEDIEERKEENGIGKTEEPEENSDFQIESIYEGKATNLVGENESGNIVDETEDCEIIPNEPNNKIVNKNSEDERKEQKEESNNDLEITMNTTNEEIKLHTEEHETITDVTCNTELSEENNEVIFENCLLDSKAEQFEQVESNMNGFVKKTSEECDNHKSCQENLKNIKMDEDDTHTTSAYVFGSEEIRNEAKETILGFDKSIEETAQLLEVSFMENDVLDTNLAGEEDNIEENKEDLFEENTSKRKVLSTEKDFQQIENVNHRHNAKDDKNVDTIFTESRSKTEKIIESTPKNLPETESKNATKSFNSNSEILLEISVDNDKQKEASQYYRHKTYSDETFKDELIFAASIVTEEACDPGHDWKEGKRGKYLESGRNWLKTEGTKAKKQHEANYLQSPIISWLPIILLIMIISYMVMMVIRLEDEKKDYANEVSVQKKDDLLDQFAYFDIMKWP